MGVGVLIQITPQLRILVAIDAIDSRKGIDSLAQHCDEQDSDRLFSDAVFDAELRISNSRTHFSAALTCAR